MNTYTKLSTGDWGVLCDERPSVGDVITVTKKDKATKQEVVAQVWTRKNKFACAVKAAHGGKCANCNRYSNQLTSRHDSSGIQGMCCPNCAGMGQYELSFA